MRTFFSVKFSGKTMTINNVRFFSCTNLVFLSVIIQAISIQTATSPGYDRLHRPLQHPQVLRVQDRN